MWTSHAIRQAFLDFFAAREHRIVRSSPLVPGNDPTLLFTNSGMVQFKDTFLGAEVREYTRAVSAQRCVRAGGKHNDLDQVGYTARHHTFFEMLGNFSFGDYFKREAIRYAWDLLTGVYGLPAERLWVTVYHTDDDAYRHWAEEIGVPRERIVRIGDNKGAPYASDNFWQMADTGPCGPCSEIFYDHGPAIPGGPPGSPEADGDRYVEIWNLVFMQFERHPDGQLTPLPKPCVDTGMGLERLAAVLQGVHSNYQTDTLAALVRAAAEVTGARDLASPSLRVIADHIRACAFLIVDGVLPSNEGRGYVLRRIIRRALRHGYKLGCHTPFFHRLVGSLEAEMGAAYPELGERRVLVERTLRAEEERFGETLAAGVRIFEQMLERSGPVLAGADVFRLYDTYGFPADLTADMARERGLAVDLPGFEALMAQQREQSRAASSFGAGFAISAEQAQGLPATEFLGYEQLAVDQAVVLKLLVGGREVGALNSADEAVVIVDRTPFYAESGGQVGDQGWIEGPLGRYRVSDTLKLAGVYHGHVGRLSSGQLAVGDRVCLRVDGERRQATVLNHSATHLLHAALRKHLGEHVMQKGSLVAPDRLRFDFSHFQPLSREELRRIEDEVNAQIRGNAPAEVHHMGFQEALDFGAVALFGEKYGERVRVLKMGEYSTELCGGTHVGRLGDIGLFKIVSESAVAAGVRRIEALTGRAALEYIAAREEQWRELAQLVGGGGEELPGRVRALLDAKRRLERELEALKARNAAASSADLAEQAREVAGVKVLSARLEAIEAKTLRSMVDELKQRLGDAVIVLASAQDGRAQVIAGVSGKAAGRVHAGDLLGHVAQQIGGRGGGRPDLAQGGGADGPALARALESVPAWVGERV